jgi:tetratricopeptide (TPR) repeat protein
MMRLEPPASRRRPLVAGDAKAPRTDRELLRRARRMYLRGGRWQRAGRYRDADAVYATSTGMLRQVLSPHSPELAEVMTAHAEAKHELGDTEGAMALARDAHAIVKGIRGDAARRARIRILGTLGNIHRARGDYRLAAPVLRRALAVARESGRNTWHAATAMNNLGILYKYTGDFARAEALYREALQITLRECGANHPDVAGLYHNLGGLAYTRGRYRAAERWGRAALELRTRLSGAYSVLTAADAAALAASLDGLGRHAEAQRLYGKVLAIFRRRYGERHYEIAVNLNNLGASLYAEGKFAEAAEHYRKALEIKKAVLGDSHIDVALTVNNLGILYMKQNRHRLALRYVEQAKDLLVRKLGARHPKSRTVLVNWRTLLATMQDRRSR